MALFRTWKMTKTTVESETQTNMLNAKTTISTFATNDM